MISFSASSGSTGALGAGSADERPVALGAESALASGIALGSEIATLVLAAGALGAGRVALVLALESRDPKSAAVELEDEAVVAIGAEASEGPRVAT
jgi:hypothetical protein